MIIETLNTDKMTAQHWQVMYDASFVYLDHNKNSVSSIEKALDTLRHEEDLRNVLVYPLINPSEEARFFNIRGYKEDESPFMVRGRKLGQIMMHMYRRNGDLFIYTGYYGSSTEWNYTDKQKGYIANMFIPAIKEKLTPENLLVIRLDAVSRIVSNLRSQIAKDREWLDKVEILLDKEAYNVPKEDILRRY